jgi:hypothetical protein
MISGRGPADRARGEMIDIKRDIREITQRGDVSARDTRTGKKDGGERWREDVNWRGGRGIGDAEKGGSRADGR